MFFSANNRPLKLPPLLTAFMRTKSDAMVADSLMCDRHTFGNYGFSPLKGRGSLLSDTSCKFNCYSL